MSQHPSSLLATCLAFRPVRFIENNQPNWPLSPPRRRIGLCGYPDFEQNGSKNHSQCSTRRVSEAFSLKFSPSAAFACCCTGESSFISARSRSHVEHWVCFLDLFFPPLGRFSSMKWTGQKFARGGTGLWLHSKYRHFLVRIIRLFTLLICNNTSAPRKNEARALPNLNQDGAKNLT